MLTEEAKAKIRKGLYFMKLSNEYGLPAVQRLKGWEYCTRRYPMLGKDKCKCSKQIDSKDLGDALFNK